MCGCGGKTSAMVAQAGELTPPVVMTTTTHLGAWQAQLADYHEILTSIDELHRLNLTGVRTALFTGPIGKDQRLAGLSPETLDALCQVCRERGYTVLIEADGARQRPLKAPAAYEPVIPEWVDHVVVLAGLSGIGQPLTEENVHRPAGYARLADLAVGDTIELEHAAQVLAAPSGSLKGIPEGARRFLFLNQAEDDLQKARGLRLANVLMASYDRILIGSLQKPGEDGPVFSAQ
ncbi:MAG: selenium cofactor biosynthesis protein YqeC, partial [Brevefilum sp.]